MQKNHGNSEKRNKNGNKISKTENNGNIDNKKQKNSKKKFTDTRLFKLIIILIIIAIIVIIINVISNIRETPKDITLIIGDEIIELKYELLIDEDENIYVSKDDLADLYDENIYYNEEEQTLITTYNKHVAKLVIGKTTMEVNSTEVALSGTMKEENDIVYVPFLSLEDVYDFEYEYNQETKVLMLDSISEEEKEALVLRNCKVKEEPKFFSTTLEKIKKSSSEYVTVFETSGEYTKVRTSKGNIGYIKTSKLSEVDIIREDMEDETLENVEILSDYDIVNSEYEDITTNNEYCYIVTPNLFDIDENLEVQSVIDLSSTKYEAYSLWAENNNVNIAATVTLSGIMNELCSSYTTRTCVINVLYNQYVNNKISMICIDFDDVDDIEGFYRFVIELAPRFKEIGFKVLVKYKDGLNEERLSNIVDYVID